MTAWTPERVIERLSASIRLTVHTTARPGPRGFKSSMPEVVREFEDYVGRGALIERHGKKANRIEEWMKEIEREAERRFTASEIVQAEEALRWPFEFLSSKPLQRDALWLTCLCHATGLELERVLRRRRAIADKLVAARSIGAPDVVTIYEEESEAAAAKIAGWVNPKLRVAQSVRVKKGLRAAARIRFAREIKATKAIERRTVVRRSDVMPGKLFNQSRVHHHLKLAAETIAERLAQLPRS